MLDWFSASGLHLHTLLLLHSFSELYVPELLGMLECGCQCEQMFEFLVLQGGLLERHCRWLLLLTLFVYYIVFHVLTLVCNFQVATRAGGFSAIVVVGMAVIGVAILYATFYVWLEVDRPGSMKVTDCTCQLSSFNLVYIFAICGENL